MKTAKQVIHRIKTIAANRHRAELDRLRIEAIVTRELLGVRLWTDNVNALHLKIDRVEGAMLKQRN